MSVYPCGCMFVLVTADDAGAFITPWLSADILSLSSRRIPPRVTCTRHCAGAAHASSMLPPVRLLAQMLTCSSLDMHLCLLSDNSYSLTKSFSLYKLVICWPLAMKWFNHHWWLVALLISNLSSVMSMWTTDYLRERWWNISEWRLCMLLWMKSHK